MLEFTGFATVQRALGYLYWLAAIGLLLLAIWKGQDKRRKIIWASVVVAVFGFVPAKLMIEQYRRDAYAKEAWAYFKKLCDEKSGEKIYKTYSGVKSVLVIKPLPPATEEDLYDQYWYGDPYSNATPWSERGEQGALRLTGLFKGTKGEQAGFEFVEYPADNAGNFYYILQRLEQYPYKSRRGTAQSTSRFGVSWEDISTPEHRKFWIAASQLRIIDLSDKSIVAERMGYFIESGFGSGAGGRRPWLTSRGPNTTCPSITNGDYEDRWFVLRVLAPIEAKTNGK